MNITPYLLWTEFLLLAWLLCRIVCTVWPFCWTELGDCCLTAYISCDTAEKSVLLWGWELITYSETQNNFSGLLALCEVKRLSSQPAMCASVSGVMESSRSNNSVGQASICKDELCGFSQEISKQTRGYLNTPPSLEQWPEEAEGHLESIRSKTFFLRGRIGVGEQGSA